MRKQYTKRFYIISLNANEECPKCDCSSCYIECCFYNTPNMNIEEEEDEYIKEIADCIKFVCPSCNRRYK